ncbi:hypothetical protein HZ326_13033 [Fusarium oxysporum f. sp. albedinis]|nr:hypothetical protein HZ326_13033 [Fusarium oxysporum f. sp. albedinis]
MPWYAVDKIFPSWQFWDSYRFISDSTDAKQIYDGTSYQKRLCVLKMVLNNLGDTKCFEGLKVYLRRHQFHCESIAASMRVWTKEHGFPVIRVSESRDASGKVTGVRLFRQRCLTSGVAKQEDVVSHTIYPLRFTIRHRQDVETVDMNTRELVLPPSGSLFKVNADHGSFFRTSYSHKLLTRPLEEASKGSLSLRDGIGLLCDLNALVAAGVN